MLWTGQRLSYICPPLRCIDACGLAIIWALAPLMVKSYLSSISVKFPLTRMYCIPTPFPFSHLSESLHQRPDR